MCFDFLRLQHMYISITFRCDGYIGKMRFECHLAVHKHHDPAYSANRHYAYCNPPLHTRDIPKPSKDQKYFTMSIADFDLKPLGDFGVKKHRKRYNYAINCF